ncbi:MAG: SirB2 family protein [Pseudomonadales bacterium]|nr:SirB2 family protein [Pseudomonadales bacterium]
MAVLHFQYQPYFFDELMNSYLLIKHLHIGFAVLSLAGFALRGIWMLTESALLQARLTRILPHINDTLLLASAIWLVIVTRQYPLVVGWVTIKIGLLLLYIGFGTMALKRGKTRQSRTIYFVISLLTIAGIFAVALIKPGW